MTDRQRKTSEKHLSQKPQIIYLGVTLTKPVKDLYDKNFKSMKTENWKLKEDTKISHTHELT